MRHRTLRLIGAAAFASAFAPLAAEAQQSTSATYDSWILQCQADAATPPHRTCAISQVSRLKDNNTPFSRLLAERPASGKPVILSAQIPVNVSTRAPLTLKIDDADRGVTTFIDKCVPGGCFADFEIADDYMKKLRAAEGVGKLSFKDAGGHDVAAPVSFKGFRAAFEALAKAKTEEGE